MLHQLSYFKAPPVAAVTPFAIAPRRELVEIVTNGVVYFHDGNEDRELGCGALFWHLPGEETIHRTAPHAPYECLALDFAHAANPVRGVPRLSIIADHSRVKELCNELLRAYHHDSVNRVILGEYARQRLLWEVHLAQIQNTATTTRPLALEAALAFLEAEFQRPEMGVPDLAKAAGLSEPRLHVLFQTFVQQTPYQMLTARRIQEAKWLLTGTALNIKALCEACGFAHIETFYRAFKKRVGMTPHDFRERHTSRITGYSDLSPKTSP